MTARWTPQALADLAAIHRHIASNDRTAADRLRDRALQFVETVLVAQPHAGRPGRVPGTREGVIQPSYILAYQVRDGIVVILAARQWPARF